MKAVFIESFGFTDWITDFALDDFYAQIQKDLMDNPLAGDLIPGCGGLRKYRVADPGRGKGKRGGARIVYLYVPNERVFLMIDGYGKDEKVDLSPRDKRVLARQCDEFKRELVASRRHSHEEPS